MSQGGFLDNKNKGFTLIELLVVISIISLLSTIVMSNLNDSREKARIAAGESFAQSVRNRYGAGLVLKYDFENDNSTTINDLSGYNYNGTVSGSYSFVEGAHAGGKAIQLNYSYITVPPTISLNKDVTVSIRFKILADNYWQRLFDFGTDLSNGYFYITTKTSNNNPKFSSSFNKPGFAISSGGSGQESVISSSRSISVGKWYYITFSFLSSEKTVIMYLDGQEVGRINNLNFYPNQINLVSNYIGKSQFTWDSNFYGQIDSVEIFNNPITNQ